MIPAQCPPATASAAERRLFDGLRDGLSNEWTVLHSLPWLSLEDRRLREGECDFLLMHPAHGLLALETKSGEVGFDGRTRTWRHPDGVEVHDPFLQASRAMHHVERVLRERVRAWREQPLPVGYAVVMPDADRMTGALPPHVLPEVLILAPDLERIEARVLEVLSKAPGSPENGQSRAPVEAETFHRLVDALLPAFSVFASLPQTMENAERELHRLTAMQIEFFEGISDNRRAIVEGVAGSGKTVLAVELAVRFAREGSRVLLVCFNEPLAETMRAAVERLLGTELLGGVDVATFHQLCERAVRETGGSWEPPGREPRKTAFYNIAAAEWLHEASAVWPHRYDAIVADEGQDFCGLWWIALEALLGDSRSGRFYIFHDPRQNLYARELAPPFDEPVFRLTQNCRNTVRIAQVVHTLGRVQARSPHFIASGEDPRFVPVADETAEWECVRKLLHDLVHAKGVAPDRIVLLGGHTYPNSVFATRPVLGNLRVVDRLDGCGANEVRYGTIYRFKGLEADCVILVGAGTGGWSEEAAHEEQLLYVAASRAKFLLYVIYRSGTRVAEMAGQYIAT